MHKSMLQDVCQKRRWPLPVYTCSREGPDHDTSFRGSVAVNGSCFNAAGISKSIREAQNKAAKAALEHISAADPPPPATPLPTTRPSSSSSSSSSTPEGQVAYKNQLNKLAQQKFRSVPVYDSICEGPCHSRLFKATVTVDGQLFESPHFYKKLREAEHAAARIALMALAAEENQQANSYKNFLQDLTQKEGLKLPTYRAVRDGAAHLPRFSSTVEIEGKYFEGEISGTKKQAEANAAKIAWCRLKECTDSRIAAPPSTVIQGPAPTSPLSEQSLPAVMVNLQQQIATSVQDSKVEISKEHTDWTGKDHKGGLFAEIEDENGSGNINSNLVDDRQMDSSNVEVNNGESRADQSDGFASPLMAPGSDPSDPNGAPSMLCGRVLVYPRGPDLVLPENCTVLPLNDDKWVAVQIRTHYPCYCNEFIL